MQAVAPMEKPPAFDWGPSPFDVEDFGVDVVLGGAGVEVGVAELLVAFEDGAAEEDAVDVAVEEVLELAEVVVVDKPHVFGARLGS